MGGDGRFSGGRGGSCLVVVEVDLVVVVVMEMSGEEDDEVG